MRITGQKTGNGECARDGWAARTGGRSITRTATSAGSSSSKSKGRYRSGRDFDHMSVSAVASPRSSQVVGPFLHQEPPTLEEVGPPVGGLDAVRIDMREHQLADIAGHVLALCRFHATSRDTTATCALWVSEAKLRWILQTTCPHSLNGTQPPRCEDVQPAVGTAGHFPDRRRVIGSVSYIFPSLVPTGVPR